MNKTIAGTLMGLALALAARPAAAGGPAVGEAAPEIAAKEWLNADEAPSLAKLRGKIVVVEFWATWCPPCRTSIPHLVEMHEAYKDKGVVLIGFTREDRKKARIDAFAEKMKMSYIVGTGSRTGSDYGVRGIPAAFLIDPEGKVLWSGHPMGGLDRALEKAVKQFPDAAKASAPEDKETDPPADPVQAEAQPILDNLMAGLRGNSYEKYSRDFNAALKKAMPDEAAFRKTASELWAKLGSPQSHAYLGSLKKGDATVTLWKGSFSKIKDDVLIKLTLVKEGGKTRVGRLYFE